MRSGLVKKRITDKNGKHTNVWVRSRDYSFKEWFKGSKVVDEVGNPKVMYHATRADFDVFNTKKGEAGAHIGTMRQARDRAEVGDYTVSIMPIYACIKNPLRLMDGSAFQFVDVVKQLIDKGIMTMDEWKEMLDNGKRKYGTRTMSVADIEKNDIRMLHDFLGKKGYDGIVYLNRFEGLLDRTYESADHKRIDEARRMELSDREFKKLFPKSEDSYIVFDPRQVKSATGNKGTFSPKSPNITKAL